MIIKTTGPDSSRAEQCGTRQWELLTGQGWAQAAYAAHQAGEGSKTRNSSLARSIVTQQKQFIRFDKMSGVSYSKNGREMHVAMEQSKHHHLEPSSTNQNRVWASGTVQGPFLLQVNGNAKGRGWGRIHYDVVTTVLYQDKVSVIFSHCCFELHWFERIMSNG